MNQEYLQKLSIPVITVLTLVVATGLLFKSSFAPTFNTLLTAQTDSFRIEGEGSVTVVPDLAILNVGYDAKNSTIKLAQDDANSRLNKATDDFIKAGINKDDIKTTSYTINPSYDYTSGTSKINGYDIRVDLNIKIRDIDLASTIIDLATNDGLNQVGGLTFTADKPEDAKAQALKLAIEDAKKKAQQEAEVAGFSLGKLISISQSDNNINPVAPIYQTDLKAGGGAAPATNLNPGTSEIKTKVTLTYQTR